jgi:hypothetical protein
MQIKEIMGAKGKASEKVQEEANDVAIKQGVPYLEKLLQVARFNAKTSAGIVKDAAKAVEADKKAKAKKKDS